MKRILCFILVINFCFIFVQAGPRPGNDEKYLDIPDCLEDYFLEQIEMIYNYGWRMLISVSVGQLFCILLINLDRGCQLYRDTKNR